jgi:hypothetical protein
MGDANQARPINRFVDGFECAEFLSPALRSRGNQQSIHRIQARVFRLLPRFEPWRPRR